MARKISKAFSLVELSIVILIIGVLIAAVGQGIDLYEDAKLSAARMITQSSRVASLKNLVLWIDSTSEASFDGQLADGDAIQNWYDINPQATAKNNFTQSTAGQRPLYKTKIINGLPAISFNGTSQNMYSTSFADISSGAFTIFTAVKMPATLPTANVYAAIISKRLANGTGNVNLEFSQGDVNRGFLINNYDGVNSWNISPNGIYVTSATFSVGSAMGFINGVGILNTTGTTIGTTASSDYLYIGKPGLTTISPPGTSTYFGGHIAEIILYDRLLNKKERQSVEAYLGKKWGVSMTVASY